MATPHLVEEFETAFQNCLAAVTAQEHFNASDSDEVHTSVEQSIQKFLDAARQLESFFLQKRLVLSIYKPEQIIREDITELRQELLRKEALIQKQYEKLQHWQVMFRQERAPQGAPPTQPPSQPGQLSQPQPAGIPAQQATPQPVQNPNSQPMPPPSAAQGGFPQGHLAYLEQTTSNIGLPERR